MKKAILLPAQGIERAIERAWREYLQPYVQPAVSRGRRGSIATPSG